MLYMEKVYSRGQNILQEISFIKTQFLLNIYKEYLILITAFFVKPHSFLFQKYTYRLFELKIFSEEIEKEELRFTLTRKLI